MLGGLDDELAAMTCYGVALGFHALDFRLEGVGEHAREHAAQEVVDLGFGLAEQGEGERRIGDRDDGALALHVHLDGREETPTAGREILLHEVQGALQLGGEVKLELLDQQLSRRLLNRVIDVAVDLHVLAAGDADEELVGHDEEGHVHQVEVVVAVVQGVRENELVVEGVEHGITGAGCR